jgi:hypothetical protein
MRKPLPRDRHWHPRLPHPVRGKGSPVAGAARRATAISDIAELSYVTVDEVSQGIVTLLVSEWPEVDERGRLRFSGSGPISIDVEESRLAAYLERVRLPERLRGRPIREGDAFAARTTIGRRAPGLRRPISGWLEAPVFDVTADARDAAKAAYLTAAGRRRTVGG